MIPRGFWVGLALLASCRRVEQAIQKVEEHKRARAAAQEKARDHGGHGLPRGRYDALIHVEVRPKHWIRQEPSFSLRVVRDGEPVGSCTIEHDSSGDCLIQDVELADAHEIDVVLLDRDGRAELSNAATWGPYLRMAPYASGELEHAAITLSPRRTWWDDNGTRIVGLGVGIAAALATLGLFRRTLFVPEPQPPRCTHCAKRIAEGALKCDYCGAAQ